MDKRWRILVVDDDARFTASLASALSRWVSVRTAGEPSEARTLLASWQPHLVVVNPVLRSGDGFSFLAQLADEPERPWRICCCLSARSRVQAYLLPPDIAMVRRDLPPLAFGRAIVQLLSEGAEEILSDEEPSLPWRTHFGFHSAFLPNARFRWPHAKEHHASEPQLPTRPDWTHAGTPA